MPDPSNRRDFVRALALAGPAAVLGAPAPARDDQEPEQPGEERKPRSEGDARMELILTRYGKSLDDDARKSVRAEVDAIVRRGESLRKFELTNGDEPSPVFTPYRAPLA